MQLRTFLAKDMKEALAAMRAQMGDEAIIVASETLKDGTVLLRAGIEGDKALPGASEDMPRREPAPASNDTHFAGVENRYRENLLARVRGTNPRATANATPFSCETLTTILLSHRTPLTIVKVLIDEAEKSGLSDMNLALASALDTFMRTENFDATDRGAVLLMGMPGAGKTSVAARFAAQHCLAGNSVVLAATDLETAGQAARLESFANCLNVPLLRIEAPEMLADAIQQAHDSQAVLIADTAACDPRESLPRDLVKFLSAGNANLVGVMSASGDAEEAGEIAAALAKLGTTRVVVTGLDLAKRKGALLAIVFSGMQIAHVTSSPYLADGLESLTPMALARMLTSHAQSPVQAAA
ncbi:MAG TPA: zeta toxin family protein [Micropepsaceae bacterium]|nr:zeta toxin family protein [Micropepsaceae bacterium]